MLDHSRLRVYFGPDEEIRRSMAAPSVHHKVTLPLAEIISILRDAVDKRRGWLKDFEQDEVTISTDLYEVLLAYQHYRRPPA